MILSIVMQILPVYSTRARYCQAVFVRKRNAYQSFT